MYLKKTFIKHVTLYEELLYGNFENNLIDYLKNIYNNYCINDCFIVDVTKINKYAQPKIIFESNVIIYTVVEFEADVIIFLQGDYIYCKIIQTDNYIICDWNNIVICNINQNNNFKGLVVNDYIPVVLSNITYYDRKIIASGDILINVPLFNTVFKITDVDDDLYKIDNSKLIELKKSSQHLYTVLYKLSTKNIPKVKTNIKKINVNNYVMFSSVVGGEISFNTVEDKDVFHINISINQLENYIIYMYNNLVEFLNSFELDKKIKILYDNAE